MLVAGEIDLVRARSALARGLSPQKPLAFARARLRQAAAGDPGLTRARTLLAEADEIAALDAGRAHR
jgi:hypothetical protein